MVTTSKEFDALWASRLKPADDCKRIEAWYKWETITLNGVSHVTIASAYNRYKEHYQGQREQYAKRLCAWLDDMDENNGFDEADAKSKYTTGIAYETGADRMPVKGSLMRFSPVAKRWVTIPEPEQSEKYEALSQHCRNERICPSH